MWLFKTANVEKVQVRDNGWVLAYGVLNAEVIDVCDNGKLFWKWQLNSPSSNPQNTNTAS